MFHLPTIVVTLLTPVLWSFALFVFFLAYVTVMEADRLGRLADANWLFKFASRLVMLIGGIIDVLFNIVFGTLLFLELPEKRNITFTHRCAKWMTTDGWRGKIAKSICHNLSVFQPEHCKPR